MLDLESAIKHCKEVAEKKEREAEYRQKTQGDMFKFLDDLSKSIGGEGVENDALNECLECADEHKQLAEWLTELKQFKEQEPCEDVISRAEALKVVDDMDIPEDMSVFEIKSHIGVEIGTLPPATSTHKKGKWEQYGDFWKEKYRCSECKEEQPKILCGEQIIRLWSNYCPHCGAEMESEE